MNSARLVFDFEELKAALRHAPDEVTNEAAELMQARAEGAAAAIRSGYPQRSGRMAKGVEVTHTRSIGGARSVVRNTDHDAIVFETGSETRHTATGANRGSMPPNHLFTSTIVRARRALWDDIRALLTRVGLVVSGDV